MVRCLIAATKILQSRRTRTRKGKREEQRRSHWTNQWARALGAISVGLVLSAAATADAPLTRLAPGSMLSDPDPRIARLERFFSYYRCDEHPTAEYLRAADGYGLDYRLLPAVSIRETGCGKSEMPANNLWGYHPGQQSFASVADGIDFIARRLMQHPAYRGKSLHDKLFTYNPFPAYPDEVKRIMRQIE